MGKLRFVALSLAIAACGSDKATPADAAIDSPRPIDAKVWMDAPPGPTYDLACYGINVSDSTLWRQLGFNFFSTSSSNRLGYKSPEMDAALDELFAAPDDEGRVDAVAKVSAIWAEDVPMATIGATDEGIFWSEGVTGIQPTQQTVFLFQDARVTD